MKKVIFRRNFYIMLALDAALVSLAYFAAFLLRFDGSIPAEHFGTFVQTLPLLVIFKVACFFIFGLYRGMWRYTSFFDLANVFKAASLSSAGIVLAILYLHRFEGYSRSIYAIDWVLTFFFIGGVRVSIRSFLASRFPFFWMLKQKRNPAAKKMLIIGAGNAVEKILREMQDGSTWTNLAPLGLLDDDSEKQGKAIHGVPVLGTIDDIEQFAPKCDEILIAIPTARGEEMRRIVRLCENTGKRFRTVPSMKELIEGSVSVTKIREVTLADLVGREEIRLNEDEIIRYLKGRRVLITGAGGSIGSELARQAGKFQPKALGLLDFSEYNLLRIEMECRQWFKSVEIGSFLVDIKNREAIRRIFSAFRPDVLLHAAAYKHVPIQELCPWEAVFNNVLGTRNLVEEAMASAVDRFVLVSTDKAVRPANVLGATKRVSEMLIESVNHGSGARFMAVRFGNVIGSSGSVIPLFQEQISRGHPVTVTHPEITRYFMSITEAAQLILQAGAMGRGGEVFILDMGKPVRIADLARDLIRLNGLEPDRDIPVEFIGLRPGEKLYEELITEGEGIVATNHEKILVLKGAAVDGDGVNRMIDELLDVAATYDGGAIKRKLREIVPEYTPQFQSDEGGGE